MTMNIAQLAVFREVMETGSMSEAARNLNRTQPAISLALKTLESSLGFELFKRHKRKLTPVPEAFYLLSEAESLLGQVSRLERTMQRLGAGEEGTLQVAAMPGLATALLPEFLTRFTHDKPDVNLSMHTRSTPQLYELVSSQGVDMGMGDFDSHSPLPTHTSTTLISGNSKVALPRNNPLASQKAISIEQLARCPLGMLQDRHPFAVRFMETLEQQQLALTIRFKSQTLLPLLQFVAAGRCCAVVDPLTMATAKLLGALDDEVVFRDLAVPVRYDYALLLPRFRPISALATDMVTSWRQHVLDLLEECNAEPELVFFDGSDS